MRRKKWVAFLFVVLFAFQCNGALKAIYRFSGNTNDELSNWNCTESGSITGFSGLGTVGDIRVYNSGGGAYCGNVPFGTVYSYSVRVNRRGTTPTSRQIAFTRGANSVRYPGVAAHFGLGTHELGGGTGVAIWDADGSGVGGVALTNSGWDDANKWLHYVVQRKGSGSNEFEVWFNGNLISQTTDSTPWDGGGEQMFVHAWRAGAPNNTDVIGIDEFVIKTDNWSNAEIKNMAAKYQGVF